MSVVILGVRSPDDTLETFRQTWRTGRRQPAAREEIAVLWLYPLYGAAQRCRGPQPSLRYGNGHARHHDRRLASRPDGSHRCNAAIAESGRS